MISRRAMLGWLLPPGAVTVAVRVSDGALLACNDETRARRLLAAPGSALKPLTLLALAERGVLPCRRRLEVSGLRLDCTHAPLAAAIDAETALAASCNCWFAAHARNVDAGLLHRSLLRAGAESRLARTPDELVLQALGVAGVRFTPFALAQAYRRLAASPDQALRAGLARAVAQGTAQLAQLDGLAVAGKTGTSREGAWFAGYAPSADPRLAVAVYIPSGRGGSDAAPEARAIFQWWQHSVLSQ